MRAIGLNVRRQLSTIPPTGILIVSFAEPHLSDPSLDEASEALGSPSKPSNVRSKQSVTPRWLPLTTIIARLCDSDSQKLLAGREASVSGRRTKPMVVECYKVQKDLRSLAGLPGHRGTRHDRRQTPWRLIRSSRNLMVLSYGYLC